MDITVPTTITIDGVEHQVADFSTQVQQLVAIHTEWRKDLATERLAAAKTEAAIRNLDAELTQLVAKELADKAAPAADAAPAAEATPAA